MNIYLFELKMYIKSVIIWSASLFAFIFMFLSFYTSFASDAAVIETLMENYPEAMQKMMNMNTGLPLSTILGYFVFLWIFIQLCLAIQAANYGFSLLSLEEREMTADFLLTRPVTRSRIIISKFLAAFTAVTITNIVVWLTSFSAIELFRGGHEYDSSSLALVLSTISFFQLFFIGIGMLVSMLLKKIKSVLPFSLGLAFGTYILYAVGVNILESKIMGAVSPFYYFDPVYIVKNGKYNLALTAAAFLIIAASLTASFILYRKRNIHSAN